MLNFIQSLPPARLKDYLFNSLSHLTLKKLVNVIQAEINFALKRPKISSYPYTLTVDTISTCQLRCPLCSTGQRQNLRPDGKMDFGLFKKIIDEIGEYLLDVHLLWWGEPFLNQDILKFVSYAHQKNIATFLSTNFSFKFNERKMEQIIRSGLDTLNISLDGITPEVYGKYRLGGDFKQVVDNIKLLVKARKKLKSKSPKIEWQFIVNKYNEHQVKDLENFKKELEVDSLVLEQLLILFGQSSTKGIKIKDWLPKDKRFRPKEFSLRSNKSDNLSFGRCWWLYRGVAVSHDGGISPCCYNNAKEGDFGNIKNDRFTKIWNNEKYILARSSFAKSQTESVKGDGKVAGIICLKCSIRQ